MLICLKNKLKFRAWHASVLLDLTEEIDRRNLLLRLGHQEGRIYKPQRHVRESRVEEETNRQLI